MKKLFYFLFAAALCVGFVGCSDDDDKDKKGSKSNIVGTWENYKDYEEDYGYDYWEEGEYVVRFKSDGTGFWLEDGYADEYFEWELDGMTLYITYSYDGETEVEVIKIKTLEKDEMVFSYDGGEYLEYYRRIN